MFLEFEFLLDVLEVWCFFANKLEGNRSFISTPTPVPRFLLASRQSGHACSNAWCYGERERERQWSHQHFLAESTEILQWFPVFSETAIWNEERDFLW